MRLVIFRILVEIRVMNAGLVSPLATATRCVNGSSSIESAREVPPVLMTAIRFGDVGSGSRSNTRAWLG